MTSRVHATRQYHAEFMRLRDRGIEDGNTNLMLLERNNFEVFGLIRDWLAQRVR